MTVEQHFRGRVLAVAAAAVAIAAVSADAKTNARGIASFDGSWSVVIVTEKGECDRAYRYPIRISNGAVMNGGVASFDISGRVNPDGGVTVRISRGERSATGIGRISDTFGAGSWSGGSCAGTWEAERR